MTMRWNYSFTVWPDETRGFPRAVFDLFRMLCGRVEYDFTQEGFEMFRAQLEEHGITLREIERVPYQDPEAVR